MIDTIKLKYRIKDEAEYNKLLSTMAEFPHAQQHSGSNETVITTARLRNIIVRLDNRNLTLSGSLPKFFLGNNIDELSHEDMLLAIESLNDIMGVNLWSAQVTRIDVGKCFSLSESVDQYIDCFEKTDGFKGQLQYTGQTSTQYKTNYSITFYDKIKETTQHQEQIPSEYKGRNILRIELQIRKHLAAELKRKRIYLMHLRTLTFNVQLLDCWFKVYKKINTKRTMIDNNPSGLKVNQKEIGLIASAEQAGGRSNFIKTIQNETKAGRTSLNQKYYFKKLLKKAYAGDIYFKKSPLLNELSNAVQNYYSKTMDELHKLLGCPDGPNKAN